MNLDQFVNFFSLKVLWVSYLPERTRELEVHAEQQYAPCTMHVTTHTRKNALSIYISPSKPQFLPPGKPHTNTFAPLLISLSTPHHSMALLHSLPAIVTAASLITLLAIALPHPANSQAPTITSCISHLLPLSPCVPFVQGKAQTPAQTCCINLQQVYTQKPRCLCLLVNGTSVGNMPINSTLATRLPAACNLKVDVSQCSGMVSTS